VGEVRAGVFGVAV